MTSDDTDMRDLLTAGLSHEDRFVRETCLVYWERQPDRGVAQAGRVIDALRAYGIQAFTYPLQAYAFPLDRTTFDRLIETLGEARCFDDKEREYFGRWFKWCLSVEYGMLPELEEFLGSERASAFAGTGFVDIGELLERLESKRQYESLDAAACHAGIEKAFARIESFGWVFRKSAVEIKSLLDQLIRIEAPERLAAFAMSWLDLGPTIETEAGKPADLDWLDEVRFGFGVYLAGEIRLTSAVDRIIDGVAQIDWDWLSEASQAALLKMPPSEPTARVRDRWWQLPGYGRHYFVEVFPVAHLPEHRDFYLENMRRADEFHFETIPHAMACALALLGDADSLEEAAAYWEANADDVETTDLAGLIYTIHRLRNEQPPVLEAIRDRLFDEEARFADVGERIVRLGETWEREKRLQQARPTVVPGKQKVGRNDPCPCGSGKKYKKCCL